MGNLSVNKRLIGTRGPVFGLTAMVIVILSIFGVALIVQSDRWGRTPAYGDLLVVMSADTWGIIYLVAAGLLLTSIALHCYRLFSVLAHTVVIMLLASWDVAFIIRYLTDAATTPVNVISWAVYVILAIRSAMLIDEPALKPFIPNGPDAG